MCGIFGLIPRTPLPSAVLERMGALLRHRGPDGEGFLLATRDGVEALAGRDTSAAVLESGSAWAPRAALEGRDLPAGALALGHRRLSILDLSAQGHQPMSYRGRYWIVFNGEIYNYLELREELRPKGHEFRTGTDTEVLLAAYAEWGEACLPRLNGMWGFALFDAAERTLFLARDRFGVKPLYLRSDAGGFAFASEIKAFSALPDWRPRRNDRVLLDFLAWAVHDHEPETMFEGVVQLPAGRFLKVRIERLAEGGELPAPERWYELRPATMPVSDWADALRETLRDSVRLRLRSDVPVGSCLSGGLDSSTIVGVLKSLRDGAAAPQKTFTASSTDPALDETAHARAVVAHAGVEGHVVAPDPGRLLEELDTLVWHQDGPFSSSSIYAQWCVFRAAREQGVVVMLDGQGADELLGGYSVFVGAGLAEWLARGRLDDWARGLLGFWNRSGNSPAKSIRSSAAFLFPSFAGAWTGAGRPAWLSPDRWGSLPEIPLRRYGALTPSVTGLSRALVERVSLPMLLHWEDRNSMSFSVEARVPFLDYRVAELCMAMPSIEKLGRGVHKAVLRRAFRGLVPDSVLDRRDKIGFATAERQWMAGPHRDGFRRRLVRALEVLPGILDPSALHGFDRLGEERGPYDFRFWRCLSAGAWVERFGVRE